MKIVHFIFLILIAIFLAVLMPTFTGNQVNQKYVQYKRTIDSLQVLKDSVNNLVIEYDSVVENLKAQRGSGDTKLIYIKQKDHENIRTINSFNNMELYNFFAKRPYSDTTSSGR